ncbi:zinc finger C2HC domain-containing protein 1A-like [Hetaerina americana]|uniref:zinc finger C2HC domain-containing protein 1A-like n=1 Tax=Hetaerina americana TaxID=62018 RepID=UPI003A7F1A8D
MVQQERGSSHESLTAIQPSLMGGGKPSVDSAYSSLNRPTFRTIEQAKEAGTKAFDHPHHGTSSEGENDHGDGWSDDEGAKKVSQNRWNAEAESSAAVKYAKFCHNCGSKYPLNEAKFCCVCGAQRLAV